MRVNFSLPQNPQLNGNGGAHKSINSEENKAFAQFKGSYVQDFPIPQHIKPNISIDKNVDMMLQLNQQFQTKKQNS